MLSGVRSEIERLKYTIVQCEKHNPHNLDIPYMKRQLKALQHYENVSGWHWVGPSHRG